MSLNLIVHVEAPNLDNSPLHLSNPLTINKEGIKLYYTVENRDFTSSLIEQDMDTSETKIVTTYSQPNSLSLIVDMIVVVNNIVFLDKTCPYSDSQSMSSYGIIDILTGKIKNTILDHINLKYATDIIVINDEEDSYYLSKSKDYILKLLNKDKFEKMYVKGAQNIKLCSNKTFISHEIITDENNSYNTYKTYIYNSNKIIKEYDDSKKFKYGDYITDFYSSKYKIYIQSVLFDDNNSTNINIKYVSEK